MYICFLFFLNMKLIDCLKRHDSCVYCMEFPDGKSYVGKTRDLGERMSLYFSDFVMEKSGGVYQHVMKFGVDNINVRILFSLSGQRMEDKELCLSIVELKYIRELGTLHPDGYNMSLGGEVLGIPVEYITTDKEVIKSYYKSNKVVLEYDLDGKFVREYESLSRCAYEKGVNSDALRPYLKRLTPYRGLFYIMEKRYNSVPPTIAIQKDVIKEKVKYKKRVIVEDCFVTKTRICNPTIVYDYNGKFVGEYSSLNEAKRMLGIGTHLTFGCYKSGYIAFKKVTDDYPKEIECKDSLSCYALLEEYKPKGELKLCRKINDYGKMRISSIHEKLKLSYPVNQFKLNGEFVAQYPSIRDASIATGIRYSQIYSCVNGKTRKAANYIWEKVLDSEPSSENNN